MNPEENNQNNQNNIVTYIFIVVIILLLGLLGYGAYTYLVQTGVLQSPETSISGGDSDDEEIDLDQLRANISGRVVMSLLNKNDEQPINVYFYNTTDTENPIVQYTGNAHHLAFEHVENSTSYLVAENENISDGDPFDIFRIDFVGGGSSRIRTEGEISERSLSWSDSANMLLYTARTERLDDTVSSMQSENWHVTLYDVSSEEKTTIDNALYGTWLPDGEQFFFSRKDGLYAYNISDGEIARVLATDWEVSAQDMFDLSPDGKYLAWSLPGLHQVRLFTVADGNFIFDEIYRISKDDANYYWPVFSPDSQYFVVQAIDAGDDLQARTNFRAEIYSVLTPETLVTQSLDDYYSGSAFIDDWIQ